MRNQRADGGVQQRDAGQQHQTLVNLRPPRVGDSKREHGGEEEYPAERHDRKRHAGIGLADRGGPLHHVNGNQNPKIVIAVASDTPTIPSDRCQATLPDAASQLWKAKYSVQVKNRKPWK